MADILMNPQEIHLRPVGSGMEDEEMVRPALALDRSADNTTVFINFDFTVSHFK